MRAAGGELSAGAVSPGGGGAGRAGQRRQVEPAQRARRGGARARRRGAGHDARCGGGRGGARRRRGDAGRHRRASARMRSGWSGAGSSSAGRARRGPIWCCWWSTAASASATWNSGCGSAIAGAKLIVWNKRDLGARAGCRRRRVVVETAATGGRRRRRAGRGDRARVGGRRRGGRGGGQRAPGRRRSRRRGDARARGGRLLARASRPSWRRSRRGVRSMPWAASPARPSTPRCSTPSSRASASASERGDRSTSSWCSARRSGPRGSSAQRWPSGCSPASRRGARARRRCCMMTGSYEARADEAARRGARRAVRAGSRRDRRR